MEQQGIKWQMVLGACLLLIFAGSIFLPVFQITGKRYIEAVTEVNELAENVAQEGSEAKEEAREVLALCRKKGETGMAGNAGEESPHQKELEETYDTQSRKKSASISGMAFIRWSWRVKEDTKPDGIQITEGLDWNKSGVRGIYRMMGGLLLIPWFFSVCTLVFMMVRRKTYALWIGMTGVAGVLCMALYIWVVPRMLWSRTHVYIDSLPLICRQVLHIGGVDRQALTIFFRQFAGAGVYVMFGFSVLLVVYGILCMTVCKTYQIQADVYEREYFVPLTATRTEEAGFSGMDFQPDDFLQLENIREHPSTFSLNGSIHGVLGQYAGCDLEIANGEELVLGRNPAICGLIFSYAGISRRHCGIRYDSGTGMYQIIDYSSNGTELSDGQTAKAGSFVQVRPGTVIFLAGRHEAFRLGEGR